MALISQLHRAVRAPDGQVGRVFRSDVRRPIARLLNATGLRDSFERVRRSGSFRAVSWYEYRDVSQVATRYVADPRSCE